MKWVMAAFWFWVSVGCVAFALGEFNEVARQAQAAQTKTMTFNERAGHMFDRAQKSDKLEDQQQDLRGGVLPGLDEHPVRPWLFLSDIGGKRLESRPAQ